MTSIKSVKWTTADGKEIEVKIEATCEMKADTAYADGWNVELGKKASETLFIKIYLNGKFYKDCIQSPSVVEAPFYGSETINKVKAANGYALLAGNIVLKKERYEEVMQAISEAKAEAAQDEEYKAHTEVIKAVEETSRPAKEAAEKELKETEIPKAAVAAYKHYKGDAEAAWEDENEAAWALIRKWTPYIEAQHGMAEEKTNRLLTEARSEAEFRIND